MEQKPLWMITSGEFAGWRTGDDLYDANGRHIGYFKGDVAYQLNGEYLGEIVNEEWLGRHANKTPPRLGTRESRGSVHSVPRARRSGRPSLMWKDPKLPQG
ncbi:MAG: hypothetical protein GX131_09820 [candidate division WS1 bacterium]|jgi:hypothetical protein|nr:hypothetical protein [candidate division WS1 bacterium]